MRTTTTATAEDLRKDEFIILEPQNVVVVDARRGRHFRLVLDQNTTLSMQGVSSGRRVLIEVVQDTTGSRTLTLGGGITGSLTMATAANSTTFLELIYDDGVASWVVTSYPPASHTHTGVYEPVFTEQVWALSGDSTDRTINVALLAADVASVQKLGNAICTMVRDFEAQKKPGVP